MKPLPSTKEMLNVARRVVWFKEPREALGDPAHFLAHVMTYGTIDDLNALQGVVSDGEFIEVLEHPPTGVFDPRSWAYWNLKYGRPASPLPSREAMLSKL